MRKELREGDAESLSVCEWERGRVCVCMWCYACRVLINAAGREDAGIAAPSLIGNGTLTLNRSTHHFFFYFPHIHNKHTHISDYFNSVSKGKHIHTHWHTSPAGCLGSYSGCNDGDRAWRNASVSQSCVGRIWRWRSWPPCWEVSNAVWLDEWTTCFCLEVQMHKDARTVYRQEQWLDYYCSDWQVWNLEGKKSSWYMLKYRPDRQDNMDVSNAGLRLPKEVGLVNVSWMNIQCCIYYLGLGDTDKTFWWETSECKQNLIREKMPLEKLPHYSSVLSTGSKLNVITRFHAMYTVCSYVTQG